MWEISKQFDFCYGHRVWSQKLDKEFALDEQCACRHLHGHQGKILVYLFGETLNRGMVTDFKHLNWFKKFIDDKLDHKFIVDRSDPLLFKSLLFNSKEMSDHFYWDPKWGCWFPEEGLRLSEPKWEECEYEAYEGTVVVPFIPTSESLAGWFFSLVSREMLKLDVGVLKVELFETPKSRAIYVGG